MVSALSNELGCIFDMGIDITLGEEKTEEEKEDSAFLSFFFSRWLANFSR